MSREVTFNGPQDGLRLKSGLIVRRGVRTEVTNDDADSIASRHDVTFHRRPPAPEGDED